MKIRIKRGDNVFILAGKDKGKTGIVKSVLIKRNRVVVSGVQVVKCFNKKKIMAGGSEFKEMPIHISNVAHVDPKSAKPTKTKIEIKDNKKLLISKKSGEVIRVVKEYKEKENV
ncbi:50S ribosomal protein L24 [Alphaproteobacteria bacterium endosymbiont of Tiliacea citrago]|uniref:50S ribosomal protein L24 n=1 Tax=Alphaproteobacteria bacterium endosymbiont of Tiliacea citrago TaxID=3077944 RepID=UPI00313BC59A